MTKANKAIKPLLNLHDLYNNVDHDLFESLVVEFCDISGKEFDYYIRNEDAIDSDRLYGEPLYQNATYNLPRRSKFLYEPTEEPPLYTPFGVHSEDIIQYAYMPKFTFSRDVSAGYTPKAGDVITTIWNNRNYEVVDVHHEIQVFLAKKLMWQFILKPYRFSEQSQSARDITIFTKLPTPEDRITETHITPLSAFGDNKFIEEESDSIDDYDDVDTNIYGY